MTITPFRSQAATFAADGYVAIGVRDLRQAGDFFRDVLDCRPISANENGPAKDSVPARRSSAILICDSGIVVELFDSHAPSFPAPARHATAGNDAPVQFFVDDAAHADQWLRREGVKVIGAPIIVTSGPHAGQTLVNFVAPWGLRLQLVSWNTNQLIATP